MGAEETDHEHRFREQNRCPLTALNPEDSDLGLLEDSWQGWGVDIYIFT